MTASTVDCQQSTRRLFRRSRRKCHAVAGVSRDAAHCWRCAPCGWRTGRRVRRVSPAAVVCGLGRDESCRRLRACALRRRSGPCRGRRRRSASTRTWCRGTDMLRQCPVGAGEHDRHPDGAGQCLPAAEQGGVAGQGAQDAVEVQVDLHHVVDRPGRRAPARRARSAVAGPTGLAVLHPAQQGGGQPFQGGADLEHVADLRGAQGADPEPAPFGRLDQALLLQLAQAPPAACRGRSTTPRTVRSPPDASRARSHRTSPRCAARPAPAPAGWSWPDRPVVTPLNPLPRRHREPLSSGSAYPLTDNC